MKSRHITKILDRTDFSRLSANDLADIGEHIKVCSNCRIAYRSAQLASILLKEQSFAEPRAPRAVFSS